MTTTTPPFTAHDETAEQLTRILAQVRLEPLDTTPWTRPCEGNGCREQARRRRMPRGAELPYLFECPLGHAILSKADFGYYR